MEIKIYGDHIKVTPAIEEYIKNKFSSIPQPEKLNKVEFKIGVEKGMQYIHFDTHVLQKDLHIEAKDPDLYAAIDSITDKIRKSIIKLKETKKSHLRP